MKKEILLICMIAILWTMGCKRTLPVIQNVNPCPEIEEEEVTYTTTFRGDIQPPPSIPWWTIDVDSLKGCQRLVWKAIRNIYPITKKCPEDPQIYGIYVGNEDKKGHYGYKIHVRSYQIAFMQSVWEGYVKDNRGNCGNLLNMSFFDKAMPEPTCITRRIENRVTYIYAIKTKYRKGGCPTAEAKPFSICGTDHFSFCSFLRATFNEENGMLVYIDFQAQL